MPPVVITTLGGFSLAVDGRVRTPPNTRNARALMACLAFEPERTFARDELVERFWPDIDPERGRANLATALWAVRRALEPHADSAVRATRTAVTLGGDVRIDVTAFEADARADDPVRRAAALRAYRGDFLPDHTDPWTTAQRERLAMVYETALQAAARETHDPELAWKSLERDPYAEDAYAVLVDHALALGNRSAARGLLTRWQAALDDLGTEPQSAFHDRVRAADALADAVDASSLPAALSSFVGRVDDAARVAEALAAARLVSLIGPGGAGKTRLALHIARSRAELFAGGLHFVDLVGIAPNAVADALAAGFGCDPRDGDALGAIARMLSAARAQRLMVLDNCEAVVGELAAAVEALLSASTHVRFLVTSREPLRLSGEAVVLVPPLPPDDAVALFAARAREAGASIGDDDRTREAMRAICARLDGLPLALELAAARAAVAPLADYERWLAGRFDLLAGTRRGGRAAHRTLRALYDDGFERLDADEQTVFRRMACAAAPWAADALAAVCSDDDAGRSAALATLWRLVGKSFVVSEADGDRARYRLLETSRAYAAEQLAAAGDEMLARHRHLAFYVATAEHAERVFVRDGERAWEMPARAIAAEQAHVAEALRFALHAVNTVDAAFSLIGGMRRVWLRFGPYADAARLIREALAAVPGDIDDARHGALWGALADVEATRGAYRAAVEAAERAIELLAGHDAKLLARAYVQLANALQNLEEDARAAEIAPLVIAAARAADDDAFTWYLLVNDALDRIDGRGDGDLEAASAALREARDLAARVRRPLIDAATQAYTARLAGRHGAFTEALAGTRAAIRAYRELRAEPYLADALVQCAWFARECGDAGEARAAAAEAFALTARLEHASLGSAALDEFAAAAVLLGDDELAATVRGFSDNVRAVRGNAGGKVPEHLARHAALGERLRAEHPAAYARGRHANAGEIAALVASARGV